MSTGDFDYGHATAVQCHIQLKAGEEEPVWLKARPLNLAQEASMKIQLKESSAGVIEPTQSPWVFPMVGVKKKDSDQLRWCVDYRGLNKKMVCDAYPLASIENNLHKLQGAKYFTTLDSAGCTTTSRSTLSPGSIRCSSPRSGNTSSCRCHLG